jgi:nitroreductase
VYEGVAALDVQGGDPLWTQEDSDGTCGGTMSLLASAVRRDACLDLQSFFRSRHSIRQFGEGSVPRQVIESAVSMAMYSPSVCNRQSWRVHVYTEPQAKASVLSLQNGNRGFGDQAAHVLIVASEIESFASVGERNQCWIDGGMFSMSLIYALHSLGLGTCCLNWSVEKEKDSALRTVAGIPDSQAVIMMIAVGPLPEVLSVARSARRPLNHIVVFHEHTKAPSTPTGTR